MCWNSRSCFWFLLVLCRYRHWRSPISLHALLNCCCTLASSWRGIKWRSGAVLGKRTAGQHSFDMICVLMSGILPCCSVVRECMSMTSWVVRIVYGIDLIFLSPLEKWAHQMEERWRINEWWGLYERLGFLPTAPVDSLCFTEHYWADRTDNLIATVTRQWVCWTLSSAVHDACTFLYCSRQTAFCSACRNHNPPGERLFCEWERDGGAGKQQTEMRRHWTYIHTYCTYCYSCRLHLIISYIIVSDV